MSSVSFHQQQISRLFLNHREELVDFLVERVRCPHVAQDLSQEIYLRLLRIDHLAHAENLLGYLFRTAERLAIDFLRYDQRMTLKHEELNEHLVCPVTQPEAITILREQCQALLAALTSLPEQVRTILLLRKIDELTYAEIAAQLHISEKTVQRQLVKAMLHCHQHLARTGYLDGYE